MVSELELNLPMLWWRILNQEPREIFGAEVAKLRNSSWGDGIPQPGYVGREYEKNGIAFVLMNPGERSDSGYRPRRRLTAARRRQGV